MRRFSMADLLTLILILFVLVMPERSQAQSMVVGVNVVNPMRASIEQQNTLLSQLKVAKVEVIRCGISNEAKGIHPQRGKIWLIRPEPQEFLKA